MNTDPALFEKYMTYLKENRFKVIALRDLVGFVDPTRKPADPFAPIERRAGSTPKREE